MPDLTLETYAMCVQLEPYRHFWNVGGYSQTINHEFELECTCKGYQFRGKCKHLAEVDQCTWHGAYDEEQIEKGVCPRCGGPTTYVQVGV
jgi:hypothetical protein